MEIKLFDLLVNIEFLIFISWVMKSDNMEFQNLNGKLLIPTPTPGPLVL